MVLNGLGFFLFSNIEVHSFNVRQDRNHDANALRQAMRPFHTIIQPVSLEMESSFVSFWFDGKAQFPAAGTCPDSNEILWILE